MRRWLAIIVLIALPLISCTTAREKETQLKNSLFTLRAAITQYTLDKQKAPQTLSQVVEGGYLREVPEDPMTGKRDWQVVMEDAYMSMDQTQPGIWDVKSTSPGTSTEGTRYNSW
jgi:general secretion pathway protein G